MLIDCISDLHGNFPQLEGGDLLIVGGDWTKSDTEQQCFQFFDWVHEQKYTKKIVIAGNHDKLAQIQDYKGPVGVMKDSFTYLCDSGTEFEGLKIWGSSWTKTFSGMNPKCKAFTVDTEKELSAKWALIPEDRDILITHCPPAGIFDEVLQQGKHRKYKEKTGSISLRNLVMDYIQPKIHVFGHIHEWGGKILDTNVTKFINASHVNERYQPVNKAIMIIL